MRFKTRTHLIHLSLASTLLLGIFLTARPVSAAPIVLTDLSTVTEDFDDYRGTTPTIPVSWETEGDLVFYNGSPNDGNAQNGVFTAGSSLYAAIAGWWALNSTADPNDYAFGLRSQTNSTSSLTVGFTNSTGTTLGGFDIDWDFEQYTEGYGNGSVSLLWSTDGANFSAAGLSGDLSATGVFGASPPEVYTLPSSSSHSSLLTTDVLDGETFYLRFLWQSVKPGNQPHFGIDNFAITPVPEPSTFVLAISAALFATIGLFRRRGTRHD